MSLTPDELRELAYYRAHARHVIGVARDRYHELARRDDGQTPTHERVTPPQRQTLKVFRGALARHWSSIFPVFLVTAARAILQCLWHTSHHVQKESKR